MSLSCHHVLVSLLTVPVYPAAECVSWSTLLSSVSVVSINLESVHRSVSNSVNQMLINPKEHDLQLLLADLLHLEVEHGTTVHPLSDHPSAE